MRRTITELQQQLDEPTFIKSAPEVEGEGCGLINASRGSLGHWVKIKNGKIAKYQVITPTSWNGSPRDSSGRRDTGRRASSAWKSKTSITRLNCVTSCAPTMRASSALFIS
jgi:Ni,Fe-hydrogenase I large subunit